MTFIDGMILAIYSALWLGLLVGQWKQIKPWGFGMGIVLSALHYPLLYGFDYPGTDLRKRALLVAAVCAAGLAALLFTKAVSERQKRELFRVVAILMVVKTLYDANHLSALDKVNNSISNLFR
jgi:NO-binding membrane sensor protein with MHYT domain